MDGGWGQLLAGYQAAAEAERDSHFQPLRSRSRTGQPKVTVPIPGPYSAGQPSSTSTNRVSQALVWWPSTTRWSMVSLT